MTPEEKRKAREEGKTIGEVVADKLKDSLGVDRKTTGAKNIVSEGFSASNVFGQDSMPGKVLDPTEEQKNKLGDTVKDRFANESIGRIKDSLGVRRETEGFGNIMKEGFNAANVFGADSFLGKVFSTDEQRDVAREYAKENKTISETKEDAVTIPEVVTEINDNVNAIKEMHEEEYTDPDRPVSLLVKESGKLVALIEDQNVFVEEMAQQGEDRVNQGKTIIKLMETMLARMGSGGGGGGGGPNPPIRTPRTTPTNTRTPPNQRTPQEQATRDARARELRQQRANRTVNAKPSNVAPGNVPSSSASQVAKATSEAAEGASQVARATTTSTIGQTATQTARTTGSNLLRGTAVRTLGRASGPLAAGMSIYEGYQGYQAADQLVESGAINEETGQAFTEQDETAGKTTAITKAAGGFVGGLAGAAKGAVIGATIGSAIPIVGTAVGGVIGSVVGGIGGYFAGSAVGEAAGDLATTTSGEAALEAAEESGLYDKDMLGNSEINYEILAQTTDPAQLNAILADDDLSDEDAQAVMARLEEIQNPENLEEAKQSGGSLVGAEGSSNLEETKNSGGSLVGAEGSKNLEETPEGESPPKKDRHSVARARMDEMKERGAQVKEMAERMGIDSKDAQGKIQAGVVTEVNGQSTADFLTPEELEKVSSARELRRLQDQAAENALTSGEYVPVGNSGNTKASVVENVTDDATKATAPGANAPVVVQAPASAPQPTPSVNVVVSMPKSIGPQDRSGIRFIGQLNNDW